MPNDQRSNKQGGQGFAGMDPDEQREIASEGGRAAHEKGTAHEFTPEEAREAGRKGGQASHEKGSQSSGSSSSGHSGNSSSGNSGSTRGGTREQHSEAGRQSH